MNLSLSEVLADGGPLLMPSARRGKGSGESHAGSYAPTEATPAGSWGLLLKF